MIIWPFKLEHKASGLPKGVRTIVEPDSLTVMFDGLDSPDQAYALADALSALSQQCRTIAQRMNLRTAIDEASVGNKEELLNVKQACELIGCARDWLYDNAKKEGFEVQMGTRAKRYSKNRIDQWIAQGGHV